VTLHDAPLCVDTFFSTRRPRSSYTNSTFVSPLAGEFGSPLWTQVSRFSASQVYVKSPSVPQALWSCPENGGCP
jgi:hypothetical protein